MIVEGKKNSAFDLLEAAMQLSDIYHKNNSNRSVSVSYSGWSESFYIDIYEWNGKRTKVTQILKSLTIYLDDADYGDTFEEAFELIEKELAQYE